MSSRSSRGYTLVEISIVIAIASLLVIGLLAFIQVAQKSSRDGIRRDAVSKAQLALEQWASTHSGSYLSTCAGSHTVRIGELYGIAGRTCAPGTSYLGQDVHDPRTGKVYSEDGDAAVEAAELVIRDRVAGPGGAGYCIRVLMDDNHSVYGATDVDKTGHVFANPASCT